MSSAFSPAEELKFDLLASGLTLTSEVRSFLAGVARDRQLTPADYASTSGIILVLDGDVWVNAPITDHNPNFVAASPFVLDLSPDDSLVVRTDDQEVSAQFWVPPEMHHRVNDQGEAYVSYGFIHTDRLRVSPIEGCAMTCKFCDLPYEFRYRTKRIEGLLDTIRAALDDPYQPPAHILVSGGTPREADYGYLVDSYRAILEAFPDTPTDIMMVPIDEVLPLEELDRLGLHEVSLNIEIYNREISRKLMRRKHDQGLDHYLGALERAGEILGPKRVRSMLMVGLEPLEDTLAGVEAIAERGCVPVLSPFRPDGSTPLRDLAPPTSQELQETYLRSMEIATRLDVPLGPDCVPCSHNTLTLAASGAGTATTWFGRPNLR